MDAHDTARTPLAGPAPAVHLRTTPPAIRRRGIRGSLVRHIRGAGTALLDILLPRSSRDPIATNPAIEYIAQTTTTLIALVDGVLHEIGETNNILRHGVHTTTTQAREGSAGHGGGEEGSHQAGDDDVGDAGTSPAATHIIYPPSSPSGADPTPGPSNIDTPSHEYPGTSATVAVISTAPAVAPVSPGPATSANCAILHHDPIGRDDLQDGLTATARERYGDDNATHSCLQPATEAARRASQRAGAWQQQRASTSQPGPSAQTALPRNSALAPHLSPSDRSDMSSPDGRLLASTLNGALGEGDPTRLQFSDTVTKNGPFDERELFVRIGTKSQLGDSALFDAGLNDIIRVCNARRTDLTQLRLEFHQSLVSGGPFNNEDALGIMTLALKPFLHHVRTVSALFVEPDKVRPLCVAQQMVSDTFSHLHYLRLAGKTSAARLFSFPLEKLRILEISADISEADVQALPTLCRNLAVLEAGPVLPRGQRDYFKAANTDGMDFPSVLRIVSAFPCKQLLANVPGEVAVQFLLTDGNSLAGVQGLISARPAWYLHLE
ncbi:uncharacterized protein SCHCODRAFT_02594099 [Schizophyllum commune H4-8]|nr:uncharacterized protein SCHCODRAFT_02564186 [Schizophyllum commune H4-8]XP_050197183.1 uncharacterized protein SCHCODRAFT_02594099 [Schizophyllum commune H4-8]KAI5885464.1 hypothetical protein SCHCODRAFT_02594099 [Schizophyllum commune H4-8]KAI5898977.1 hypothetical protein SCHCODRAFT_02564186 [Schizophyllum commune H4-8]